MKLIVLSSLTPVPNEHQIINSMFEEGLEMFQVNKPTFTKTENEKYIQQIDARFHDRISMHADFPKFHSLEDLKKYYISGRGQMAFLSPIFDSISKQGYKSEFSEQLNKFTQLKPELIAAIKSKNIIALGGINTDKIELARKVGFKGVATLGAIWNSKDPVATFISMRDICNSKAFLRRELFLEESKTTAAKGSHE